MENIYHKFVLDHLSELDPPLFFDHFKFAYANRESAQRLLATSFGYLQNFKNDPAINSLAREKAIELKNWKESRCANDYWHKIEMEETKQKAQAAAKISELQIEATLHKDSIHYSSAVSSLAKKKITALSKRPNSDVDSKDLKNNFFIVTEEQKEASEPIEPPITPSPHTGSEDIEHNPFIVIKEQKEAPESIEPPITPSPHTGSEDIEHNPFIVTEEQKEAPEPTDSPTTPSPHTGSEDIEHNPFIVIEEQKEAPEPINPRITPLPNRSVLKRPRPSLDSFEMDLDWAPWNFNTIIDNVDIEQLLQNLYKKCQKTRPKTKTSLDYGIIDLNNSIILEALGKSIKLYFEAKIQDYKPKKSLSKEVSNYLRKFNVTSLKDLGKALSEVIIDYNDLDRDIIYLYRLFQKFFLLFQNNSSLNLDSSELQEGWYNSHIVAPIFDDCLESVDEWILRRGEVESCAQKCLDRKSRKKKKYDGILSFSRQFEFIYVETATTSIVSKTENDLSKLHQAIILMFKLMVSTLPEKILEEISSMPVLCVQFCGASAEIYLANWPKNMRPIVFSIMNFDIPEEVTALPKLTKVAAKMLSLRSFIQNLNNKYQALLKKAADYYLDEENDWDSPLKLKARC